MKRITILAAMIWFLSASASAELVAARFGTKGKLSHPDTLKVIPGQPTRLMFDLSAIPKDAKVHAAWLFCAAGGQPREPAEIVVADRLDGETTVAEGKPLALRPPWFRSFELTDAVRAWVANPDKNLGLVVKRFDNFRPADAVLEVRYEGKAPPKTPAQTADLKVIHHDGQTFLTFQEIPAFRPAPEKILWIDDYADADKQTAKEPGAGGMGNPRIPGITLETLRVDLQGLEVRTTPGKGQDDPPFKRIRPVPDVEYRVYRSDKPITADNLKDAELVGEADALIAYDMRMLKIYSSGEYYSKHEQGDNVIGTVCIADHQGVMPGYSYYVHTPAKDAQAYYAVTVVQDGLENTAIGPGNSLAKPVEEKVQPPKPLKYFSVKDKLRGGSAPGIIHQYLFWVAPPLANLPDNKPRRVGVAIMDDYKEPGPLLVNQGGAWLEQVGTIMLGVESAGNLVYIDGRGTLKSYRESKLDYFPERYFFYLVDWTFKQWKVDPARISGMSGMSLHMAIRHPEFFGAFWPDRPNYFQNDFDLKWNPSSGSLGGWVGPPEIVRAPDGSPGWNVFDMGWYLRQDVGKDIPFMACLFSQPKDGNHGAEYGWQDDPKGYAALRDCRQPYVGQWGGGGVSGEVRNGLYKLRWDKSVPAFSNCSLDNSPGNGDPDDGDPYGQINGWVFWEYDTIAEQADRWEMTVYVVPSCPNNTATVDITPRHCKSFKPKAGQKYKWTNTQLADNKVLGSDVIEADKWNLVTILQATVTKGKNRIVIEKQP